MEWKAMVGDMKVHFNDWRVIYDEQNDGDDDDDDNDGEDKDDYCNIGIILNYVCNYDYILITKDMSTAVWQALACAPVTKRARVRSPVGTSFLGEIFSGFFLNYKTNVRKL